MVNFIGKEFKFKLKELFRKNKKKHYCIYGENNVVKIKNAQNFDNLKIYIYGNNNFVDIKTSKIFKSTIYIGTSDCMTNNCQILIEEDASSNGVMMRLMEDESIVSIGKDAMLSDNINIFCSDTHSIFNTYGQLSNRGHFVEIGEHVWICTGVSICKNTKIVSGCIVGMNALVSGKFEEHNCVIAGNPARIVKKNIRWDRERPNIILQNTQTL